MKPSILSVVALGAALLTTGFAAGENAAAPQPGAAKSSKLAKVVTINGAQAVREFQNNVRILQAEREQAQALSAAYEKETNASKKKELKTKLDAAMSKLNQDNTTMSKTYGFSLARNYVMEVETANIYTEVTDEEAARLEQLEKQQAQKSKK